MKTYVAVDISGRLSGDCLSLAEVQYWMGEYNPNSGDCVVWEKPSMRLVAYRKDNVWVLLS